MQLLLWFVRYCYRRRTYTYDIAPPRDPCERERLLFAPEQHQHPTEYDKTHNRAGEPYNAEARDAR